MRLSAPVVAIHVPSAPGYVTGTTLRMFDICKWSSVRSIAYDVRVFVDSDAKAAFISSGSLDFMTAAACALALDAACSTSVRRSHGTFWYVVEDVVSVVGWLSSSRAARVLNKPWQRKYAATMLWHFCDKEDGAVSIVLL